MSTKIASTKYNHSGPSTGIQRQSPRRCHSCNQTGHLAHNCLRTSRTSGTTHQAHPGPMPSRRPQQPRLPQQSTTNRQVRCYFCGLVAARNVANGKPDLSGGEGFYYEDDLLYRQWEPKGSESTHDIEREAIYLGGVRLCHPLPRSRGTNVRN